MSQTLHLSTSLSGGAGILSQRLHQALGKKNFPSTLLFRQGSSDLNGTHGDRRHTSILWRNWESIAISQQWKKSNHERGLFTGSKWVYPTKVSDLIAEADIINLHWISRWIDQPSFFNSIPPQRPIVWSLHDMNPLTGGCHHALDCDRHTSHCDQCPSLKKAGSRDQAWQNFELKAKLYPKLNLHFVGNSTWTTQQAENSALGKLAKSIRTIHLGIDIEQFKPIDKTIAKAALRINPDHLAIAFACADLSDTNKNLAILVDAIEQLAQTRAITFTLILFGAGQTPELNSQIDVVSLGSLSSSPLQCLVYSAADLFVMPSRIESFGLTALESMACATPVLAFRTGGIPDLVIHGQTGWLADQVGSTDALYQGLLWMADHPQERQQMGRAARERVEQQFTDQLMADRYICFYQEISSI